MDWLIGILFEGHTNDSTDHFRVIDAEDLKEFIVSSQEVGRQARLCDLSHVLYREFELIDFFADKVAWDIGLEEKCDLILQIHRKQDLYHFPEVIPAQLAI